MVAVKAHGNTVCNGVHCRAAAKWYRSGQRVATAGWPVMRDVRVFDYRAECIAPPPLTIHSQSVTYGQRVIDQIYLAADGR